jgi:protein O-GlcNAc transferase
VPAKAVIANSSGCGGFGASTTWPAHPPRIGLYFCDGPQDYRSQLVGLLLAEPFLADRAIIVVDDQNFVAVKQATWDFLVVRTQASVLFELPTPGNCHPSF